MLDISFQTCCSSLSRSLRCTGAVRDLLFRGRRSIPIFFAHDMLRTGRGQDFLWASLCRRTRRMYSVHCYVIKSCWLSRPAGLTAGCTSLSSPAHSTLWSTTKTKLEPRRNHKTLEGLFRGRSKLFSANGCLSKSHVASFRTQRAARRTRARAAYERGRSRHRQSGGGGGCSVTNLTRLKLNIGMNDVDLARLDGNEGIHLLGRWRSAGHSNGKKGIVRHRRFQFISLLWGEKDITKSNLKLRGT